MALSRERSTTSRRRIRTTDSPRKAWPCANRSERCVPGVRAGRACNNIRAMKAKVADYETLVNDVGDLRAFAVTCDLKALTAAAQLMGESKATTSRRITR